MKMASPVSRICRKQYRCACYFTDNIYLRDYNVHLRYFDENQLFTEYGQFLSQRGCNTTEKRQQLIQEIQAEVERRESVGEDSVSRRLTISTDYTPPHPEIYSLKESYLHPKFRELVSYCKTDTATVDGVTGWIKQQPAERVYSFPVFTPEFCQRFIELIQDFEASPCPKGRPNTMNQYGVLLDELGLDDELLIPLRENYLQPITRLLYPDIGGDCLDSHKAFVVQYKLSEDKSLSYHFDNAEITLNVSLGADFSGGNLYFGAMKGVRIEDTDVTECEHSPGTGVLHRGQHKHGAQPILSGERFNLIMWMRSSSVRNEMCPMCGRRPELIETVGKGDGFSKPEEPPNTINVCHIA